MKNKKKLYLSLFVVAFIAIEIALYFVHPFAPAVVFISCLVQAPIIFLLFKAKTNGSYDERAQKRRADFHKDSDAEKWLKKEEAETSSIGYKYWSTAGKSLSALNRAEILILLQKNDQAVELLAQVQIEKLSIENKERFFAIQEDLQEYFLENVAADASALKSKENRMNEGDSENVDV